MPIFATGRKVARRSDCGSHSWGKGSQRGSMVPAGPELTQLSLCSGLVIVWLDFPGAKKGKKNIQKKKLMIGICRIRIVASGSH